MFEGVTTFGFLLAIIVILVVIIILTLLTIVVYSGLFSSIDDVGTGKPPIGQLIIAYKFQRGPYNEAGQLFTEAAIIAPENKAIGIYYDDPQKVDSHYLRYAVGSVISEGDAPVDEEMVKKFTEKEFKILHLPEVTYAVKTKFPHITTLSILIAVRKAYPMMQQYVEEHKLCAHPFMEYYDGDTIHFLAPLSKQDEFYVPECGTRTGSGDAGGSVASEEWDSSSDLSASGTMDESQASLDLTQTTLGSFTDRGDENNEDSRLGTEDRELSVLKELSADEHDSRLGTEESEVSDQKEEKDGGSEVVEKAADEGDVKQMDDDQVSDDSSSSYEVVKRDQDLQ